jgi:hypothetical protein
MSPIMTFMIGGWIATTGRSGFCALNESGKLLTFRKGPVVSLDTAP